MGASQKRGPMDGASPHPWPWCRHSRKSPGGWPQRRAGSHMSRWLTIPRREERVDKPCERCLGLLYTFWTGEESRRCKKHVVSGLHRGAPYPESYGHQSAPAGFPSNMMLHQNMITKFIKPKTTPFPQTRAIGRTLAYSNVVFR